MCRQYCARRPNAVFWLVIMPIKVLFAHVGLKYNHVGLTCTLSNTHNTIGTPKCKNAQMGVIEYNVGLV